jgi:hypothetical protein
MELDDKGAKGVRDFVGVVSVGIARDGVWAPTGDV